MAETTIEWTRSPNGDPGYTFNGWEGCQKAGPGCDHCYAEARNRRFNGGQAINWGPGAPRRRTSEANWRLPLKWNAEAERLGTRRRVFCSSLADVFDNEVDPKWRADLFELINETPNLDWLLLTKRIGNAAAMIEAGRHHLWVTGQLGGVWPLPNVWIGATIVNQAEADRDIPKLLAVPAAKRFLSMEPLLGPVDLRLMDVPGVMLSRVGTGLDWVIVGGESGPGARPMHPDWARSLRDQCQAAGVAFLFKQWGEWLIDSSAEFVCGVENRGIEKKEKHTFDDLQMVVKVGKKAAGRLLDGRTWDEVPG